MRHKERSFSTPEGWLFANPVTGKPYHQEEIQKRYISKAGIAAKIGGDIGWHTFRHSYHGWPKQGRLSPSGVTSKPANGPAHGKAGESAILDFVAAQPSGVEMREHRVAAGVHPHTAHEPRRP